jgi:hypothetical protein
MAARSVSVVGSSSVGEALCVAVGSGADVGVWLGAEEEEPQAPNARTQMAASRADDRVLMDMWHLVRMSGGCRTLQDRRELINKASLKK